MSGARIIPPVRRGPAATSDLDWLGRLDRPCLDDPALFDLDTPDPVALDACRRCPVLDECRAYALSLPLEQQYGTLAGLGAVERRKAVRRERRRSA